MIPALTELAGELLMETVITLLLGAISLFHCCCGLR